MSFKGKKTRRDFLKSSLIGLSTPYVANTMLGTLASHLLEGGLSKAYAESMAIAPRRMLSIAQQLSPARWTYDLFLTPYSSTNFKPNAMVGTSYAESEGRYTSLAYKTVNVKGIDAPLFWGLPIPKAGGGDRSVADLLDNLLCVQGITTKNAGHTGSIYGHYSPLGANQSLNAMVSDRSKAPLEAVMVAVSDYIFQSNGSSSLNTINSDGNLISKLLTPFQRGLSPTALATESKLQVALDNIDSSLADQFLALHSIAESNLTTRASARQIANSSLGNLDPLWLSLLNKYKDLIARAIDVNMKFTGFNNLPVGITGPRDKQYALNAHENVVTTPDVRDVFNKNMSVNRMAQEFAIAEYLLTNNLSYSIAIAPGTVTGFTVGNGNTSAVVTNDGHFTGAIPGILVNFYHFRALSACLLELIDQLKAKKMFDETIIDVFGEFNRAPRADGFGADHGFQAKSVAYYSGAFKGPLILGEIINSSSTSYPGTWGMGAVDATLGTQIDVSNMFATTANLLRAPSPFLANISPVVNLSSSGVLTPLIPKTRIRA